MSKVSNTLTMLRLLESGRKYTVEELSEIIEVKPRMIKIYKEELEKCGIYIDSVRGKYGGYIYHKNNNQDVSFNYLDVDAIESVLCKLDNKEKEKIELTLEKIRTIVIYSADEKRNLKVDKADIDKKYDIISKAIKNKKNVSFRIHNKERKLIPQSFTYYKDFVYITGYSILEDDIKTINLSAIVNLKECD